MSFPLYHFSVTLNDIISITLWHEVTSFTFCYDIISITLQLYFTSMTLCPLYYKIGSCCVTSQCHLCCQLLTSCYVVMPFPLFHVISVMLLYDAIPITWNHDVISNTYIMTFPLGYIISIILLFPLHLNILSITLHCNKNSIIICITFKYTFHYIES